MRRIWIFILLLAISCQLSAVSGLVSGCELCAMSNEQSAQGSQPIAHSLTTAYPRTVDRCPLSVDFYENQIRLADSLYKNYLPQHNFEEVKAAVEFFERERETGTGAGFLRAGNGNKYGNVIFGNRNWSRNPRTQTPYSSPNPVPESRTLLCARAHYYHAVGLTERDDIVGACEHYLRALEIMEFETENLRISKSEKRPQGRKVARSQSDCHSNSATMRPCDSDTAYPTTVDRCLLSVDNPEDYEKIRFLALTYTRLGRLFYDENYCDLAILKYKKALNCLNIIKDSIPISYTYKNIGNVYQLLGKADSALYHYRKSLEINPGQTNKLDLEKNIAQILFEKGEKDSAYILIKNNLDKMENTNVRYSYYNVLGVMCLNDKEYDSAVYYLDMSIKSNISDIKFNSAIKLSAIYDSIGDYRKKAYYDDIVSKLSITNINKNIETSKLQDVYDNYKESKYESERIDYIREKKLIIISLSGIVFFVLILVLLMVYRSKRKESVFLTTLREREKDIIDKDAIIGRTNKEIKQKDTVIKRYSQEIEDNKKNIDILRKDIESKTKEISHRDSTIKKQKKELDKLKHDGEGKDKTITFKDYYESDICKKILSKKESDFTALSDDELALLLEAADKHLSGMTKNLCEKYPRLRKEDLNCICLILLNINTNRLHYLLGRNRKTVWERINKIRIIMNIGDKKDLFLSLKEELYR